MRKLAWLFAMLLGCAMAAAAQDAPKAELFGGYSYMHSSLSGAGFNFNGGSGSIAVNPTDWFGIVGDFGAYHSGSFGIGTTTMSYLVGPRFSYRKNETFTPYVHALFGGAHVTAGFGGVSGSDSAFAMAVGGGLDAKVSKHVAIRVAQVDYVLTKFNDGGDNRQNSVRVSTGIVYRWE